MMHDSILDNAIYKNDLDNIIKTVNTKELENKTIIISGATGMIGKMMIDAIFSADTGTHIIALGRSKDKAEKRFASYINHPCFRFFECDITSSDSLNKLNTNVDYIIHLASTTHPIAYATEPIGTITSNVLGTMNLLEYGMKHGIKRFLFSSSVEVYGENKGDTEYFKEKYCGYLDCNTLRAGYPESKRLAEALCQAYRKQYQMDICIARLARTFGPTMQSSDSKAIAQFIKKAIDEEDIILKSAGTQLYSYCYAADAVSGLLSVLINGKDGEAYNISGDSSCDITLKELASTIAATVNRNIRFEIPDETEKAGYSKATKALLDISKASEELKWKPHYEIKEGIEHTISILKAI